MTSRRQRLKERFKSIKQKSLYKALLAGLIASYKRRVQKEKDDLAREGKGLRNIAFFLTLISMMLAFSFVPLFPQPLPIFIAVLVAFLVFVNPAVGLSLGSIPIVLGLLYNLAKVDFISMLGPAIARVLFICLLIFFFVALPVRFRHYEDAIGINIGIIAATLLFFNATYFLAIPLLLSVAVILKKTQAGLAIAYYSLISIPLMLMQYFLHILTINRADFWNDITAVPPIYVSLSSVFGQMQGAIAQFRIFDLSQTLGRITWEVIAIPPIKIHTVSQAITQYLDSFPGMILFLIMVGGIVWAVSLIVPSLVSKSKIMRAETIFPVLSAAGVTILFFLLLAGLQRQLAFSAQIDSSRMILGSLAALGFAVPAAMLNFAPKKKALIEKNTTIILSKSAELQRKLQRFAILLEKVKQDTPVDVKTSEIKMLIVKDRLEEIIAKATERKYKVPETFEKIKELDSELTDGINSLCSELNLTLEHFQLNLNYSYTAWIKKLRELDYPINDDLMIEFKKDQEPEERIEYIIKVLKNSRTLANEVCDSAERTYCVVRSIYDPDLAETSPTIAYVRQKLEEKTAPWIACEALIIAFKNWNKHYKQKIAESTELLQESLATLSSLDSSEKPLLATIGNEYPAVREQINNVEEIKSKLEQSTINLFNLKIFENLLQSSLESAQKILSVFHDELKNKEESIESMLPILDNFWEKNVTLREQLADAVTALSDSKVHTLNQRMHSLPAALSLVNMVLWTMAQYNLKNESLLNYPLAKSAIENLLKKKKHVSAQDLPFGQRDAEAYLKMFYNERNREFIFDEESLSLTKKA